jgi:ribosome recycling factor
VQKAIQDSPLGLNPSSEGSELLVKLPRMTNETVQKMIKMVHLQSEGAHLSIRRARQKGMDAVKAAFKGGSEDARKVMEKEVRGRSSLVGPFEHISCML